MGRRDGEDIDLREQRDRILEQLDASRRADWDWRTGYHPPQSPEVIAAHEKARALVGQVGHDLLDIMPACPEVEQCLAALDLALMHANAAIARHHPDNQAAA